MIQTSRKSIERSLDDLSVGVVQVRGDPCIGPSDLRSPTHQEADQKPKDGQCALYLDHAEAQDRLNTLVNACSAGDERSFHKHKEQLLTDLAPPYALFCFVKAHPNVADLLRTHKALKDRARQISKTKIALLSIYCKMQPITSDERKSCSDWTIWLEQAHHKEVKPDDFIDWGMGKNFKDCRDEVRDRRRIAKTSSSQSTGVSNRPVKLSLRETATGATVTLQGCKFDIPKSAMEQVIAEIKRAAPEGMLDSDNDNDGSDTDA